MFMNNSSLKKNARPYIIAIIIAMGVGLLSTWVTRNHMDIYDDIILPPLAPPVILFPIVWTILYFLMGISSGAIAKFNDTRKEEVSQALFAYGLQLFFNLFWSFLFFNMRSFLLSFIWLVVLWFLILRMIFKFYKINPVAAYLQIPYLLWVAFAGYLNFAIYWLNM